MNKDGEAGIEYVSCPLTINKKGFDVLDRFTKYAIKNGIYVNSSCGLHIHINVKSQDRNLGFIAKVLTFYKRFGDEFFKMLPKSRSNNHFCQSLNSIDFKTGCPEMELDNIKKEKDILEFKKKFYYGNTSEEYNKYFNKRYYWINVHSIFHRGTIEIRSHSATIDSKKITNWLKIHKKCLDFIMRNQLEHIEGMTVTDFYNIFDKGLLDYITYRQNLFMDKKNRKAVLELYSALTGLENVNSNAVIEFKNVNGFGDLLNETSESN